MNLIINHDAAYSFVELGDFPDGLTEPMSATGPFSWYVFGSVNGSYRRTLDNGTNVLTDTLNIPTGTTDVGMYLTGQVSRGPWFGDYTGTGTFTLQIGEPVSAVPEPASGLMLGVALLGVLAWKMFGRGKCEPVAGNETDAGRAANRRVTVDFVGGAE